MLIWVFIILGLVVFQVLGHVFAFPQIYLTISTLLMLVGALGLLYREYKSRRRDYGEEAAEIKRNKLLGQLLREAGYCDAEQVLAALNRQTTGDARRLGEILVDMDVISEEQLEEVLVRQRNVPEED